VIQNLNEERGRFEDFHGRVLNLVQELTAQRGEDKELHRRAQKDLESRLIEQSRLLNESECELAHLRGEIENARKAEHGLRIAIIELEGCTNAASQKLIVENAQLQAALDRATAERARLLHELADSKRRRAEQAKAAERVDCAPIPEGVKDIAAERARRSLVAGYRKRHKHLLRLRTDGSAVVEQQPIRSAGVPWPGWFAFGMVAPYDPGRFSR
jgi:hypothetical protein